MRIGIGHPGAKELVNGYVLHDFAKADREWLEPLLAAIADNVGAARGRRGSTFMNRVHLATTGEEEKAGKPATESSVRDLLPRLGPPSPARKAPLARLRGLEEALRPRALKAVPLAILES